MVSDGKFRFGSEEWFQMQVGVVRDALIRLDLSHLPHDFSFSMVERFVGANPVADGVMQGFRIDYKGHAVDVRRGVRPDEKADAIVEMTIEALDRLAHLAGDDPEIPEVVEKLVASGQLVRSGNFAALEQLESLAHEIHAHVHKQTL